MVLEALTVDVLLCCLYTSWMLLQSCICDVYHLLCLGGVRGLTGVGVVRWGRYRVFRLGRVFSSCFLLSVMEEAESLMRLRGSASRLLPV